MYGDDVKATQLAASGSVNDKRTRVKGVHYVGGASAGTIVLKNNGTGGTAQVTINTPATATFAEYISFGEGMLFATDCYCTITNTAFVTVFWDG